MIEAVAAVVTAVGVVFAGVALRSAQLQRNRQFESLYVQRYWSLLDRLSLTAIRGAPYDQLCDGDKLSIQQYMRLCEDQLEMRAEGAITGATHAIWADGIVTALASEPFQGGWADVRSRGNGSFRHLASLELDATYDPLTSSPLRRWMAGVG